MISLKTLHSIVWLHFIRDFLLFLYFLFNIARGVVTVWLIFVDICHFHYTFTYAHIFKIYFGRGGGLGGMKKVWQTIKSIWNCARRKYVQWEYWFRASQKTHHLWKVSFRSSWFIVIGFVWRQTTMNSRHDEKERWVEQLVQRPFQWVRREASWA